MFWRRRREEAKPDEAWRVARSALEAAHIDFDASDALTQALVGTFIFGMLHAYGRQARIEAPALAALACDVFEDVLHYTPEAAREGVQHCIDATRPDNHPTMNAILHRGIDGYAQYVAGDDAALSLNIRSILDHFDRGEDL